MRLALIGMDDITVPLLRAIAASADHVLVAVSDAPEYRSPLRQSLPASAIEEPWEGLLERSDVDATIVATGPDQALRDEQLRRLVRAGMPLLVVHPACDVMVAYEIEMIRRDTGGVIVPFTGTWWHPGFDRLADWSRQASDPGSGNLEQVIFERCLSVRGRNAVLQQFGRDVWPIRRLLGNIPSVSAAGVSDGLSLANLTVHCTGDNDLSARWSVMPAGPDHDSTLTVVGVRGTAVLRMRKSTWEFESRGAESFTVSFPLWDEGRDALDRLQRAIDGEPALPSWAEACLDLEAIDSVEKSLRRKRAIDLHTGEVSEDQTFKGFMAAAGCLILMVILLAFVFLAVFEGFRSPLRETFTPSSPHAANVPKWPLWVRLWPVYPLLGFLVLQFLLLLAKRASRDDSRSGSTKPGSTNPSNLADSVKNSGGDAD